MATAGSFTGAAKLLHISQPTVTTQVRFLEEMYRVELFYRSGRTIKLTPMGEQLYVLAKRTFALESETVQLLRDSGELRTGQLRIGAVGPFHVTEMLALFNQRFPGIHVSVRMGNSESALRALKAYQTDVAVLARFMDDPQLHLVPYSSHPVGILVNHEHPFAHRKSIRIEELEGQRMVLREEGSTTRKALEDALGKAGVQCRVVMEIGSREAIREAVIMGLASERCRRSSTFRIHACACSMYGEPGCTRMPTWFASRRGDRREWCKRFSMSWRSCGPRHQGCEPSGLRNDGMLAPAERPALRRRGNARCRRPWCCHGAAARKLQSPHVRCSAPGDGSHRRRRA